MSRYHGSRMIPCILCAVLMIGLQEAGGRGHQAHAGDWPQLLGPNRNGHATDENLFESWHKSGPRVLWKHAIGSGYAGPAVSAGKVIAFHRVSSQERLEALTADTGQPLWQADYEATYRGGYNADTGPRCVPLIHRGKVYAFGAAGVVYCVRLNDGQKIWSRNVYEQFRGDEGFFGAGSTPIAVGNHLLINVGGQNNAGIVALSLLDGSVAWTASNESASYSSPVVTRLDGRQLVLFLTRLHLVGVTPDTGKVLLRHTFGKKGLTVTAATPLVFDQHVFLTASYGIGATVVRLGPQAVEVLWENRDVMSSQYNTGIYQDGFVYGIHGREDAADADLRCIDAKTGKVVWNKKGFGVAHLLSADGKLLIVKGKDGQLVLARADPSGFEELSRALVLPPGSRALPALSNGRLYVRGNPREDAELRCLAVGPTE